MKAVHNCPEKFIWEPMRVSTGGAASQPKILPRMMVWLILFVSATYVLYTLKLVSSSHGAGGAAALPCADDADIFHKMLHLSTASNASIPPPRTGLEHIVFGIAASAKLWEQRKEYIKLWWRPERGMRGIVWLDSPVKTHHNESGRLPELKISGDTSRFAYKNRQGHRSAIRISRIDRCIQRYPGLYGSDDRMQACMAELGVPLTKELGFHQYDVYGNLFGLLSAHPVTPLVSLHHLDVVEPIFPNATRLEALKRLKIPMQLDSAGLMQQSICYDKKKGWTVSVSWGFAIQVFRGVLSPREIEMPSRTFLNWYRRADYTAYAFNTRPVMRNPCQKPFVFYFSKARTESSMNQTLSRYTRHHVPHPQCRWKMTSPGEVETVEVYKKPDPHLWDRMFLQFLLAVAASSHALNVEKTQHVQVVSEEKLLQGAELEGEEVGDRCGRLRGRRS
ncbi:hypothetical protein SASPL_150732 [Salvia splendens]|uniref:Fringe-related protein n=1 Tax=Salvia splendens TaxID=180675 RepID=A0A8X8Z335_SALSN|nr:hypothetical protein SASPL_150732 [Salvia splendens]